MTISHSCCHCKALHRSMSLYQLESFANLLKYNMLVTNITLSFIQRQLQNILSSQSINITYEMLTRPCHNIWYGYDMMS